ncbi:MAG: replicative DNA helicase [Nitrospirae bacterium RBG_13_39_12]|nr:MAG: replicative DNA helicase [Nitrospirae bacterium RBG_13_39_12]
MKDIDLHLDRVPPQNIEAEQSILGAVLIDNEALPKALEIIDPEDFYKQSNRKIFYTMTELFERSEPIDLVTLSEHLKKNDQMEAVGGISYLSSLVNMVPTAANVRYHSKIVREKAILRGLLRSATEIASRVYEDNFDAEDLVDYAEKSIFEISDKRIKATFVTLKDVIKDSFQMIENLYDKKETVTGVPSGYKDLDELTTGFQKGDLIVIGGRPSMGKTAFALNIAQHVGVELKEPVAIFSLEMAKEQLALRMLCAEAMVNSNSIRKGFIKKEDWHKLTSAASNLTGAPIFIDDSSSITVLELRAKARRLKMEHGLSLVIVDYLQLMRGKGSFERREQEISDISRSLKALAKELSVPVIAVSQLNRSVEQRRPPKPILADLRESGAIEQDADVILFLYRDEIYNKDNQAVKGLAEVDIAKQRNGPAGETIKLTFMSKCTRFMNRADRDYQDFEEEEAF